MRARARPSVGSPTCFLSSSNVSLGGQNIIENSDPNIALGDQNVIFGGQNLTLSAQNTIGKRDPNIRGTG